MEKMETNAKQPLRNNFFETVNIYVFQNQKYSKDRLRARKIYWIIGHCLFFIFLLGKQI